MKLNKQKWIQEVRRVEGEIKLLKKMMHEPHYQRTFPFSGLFQLKAEATRLYTLRRVMKGKSVELETFWHLVQSKDAKYIFCYFCWPQKAATLTSEQVVSLILDGVPAWRESFLVQADPESPTPDLVLQPA